MGFQLGLNVEHFLDYYVKFSYCSYIVFLRYRAENRQTNSSENSTSATAAVGLGKRFPQRIYLVASVTESRISVNVHRSYRKIAVGRLFFFIAAQYSIAVEVM